MSDTTPTDPDDYTLEQVATKLGMSKKWVRLRIKDGAEHIRRGHKIFFSPEQYERLRTSGVVTPTPESITTGPKKVGR